MWSYHPRNTLENVGSKMQQSPFSAQSQKKWYHQSRKTAAHLVKNSSWRKKVRQY